MNAKTPMLRAIASSNSGPAGPEVASGNVLSIRKHRSKRVHSGASEALESELVSLDASTASHMSEKSANPSKWRRMGLGTISLLRESCFSLLTGRLSDGFRHAFKH